MCALVLGGCNATATVRVDVQPDGSGVVAVDVSLDAEAAAHVGDLSKLLAVDDLTRAGWKVTRPGAAAPVHVRLEHPFSDIDEANAILGTLSGPDGPFRDVELSRHRSLFKTEVHATGTVDLSRGLDTFGDADLTRALGGTLSDTVAASGEDVPSGDDLTVALRIDTSSMGGGVRSVSGDLGSAPQTIDVHASKTRWGTVTVAAVVVGGLLVALVLVGFRLRRRANHAQRSLLPDIEVSDPFEP